MKLKNKRLKLKEKKRIKIGKPFGGEVLCKYCKYYQTSPIDKNKIRICKKTKKQIDNSTFNCRVFESTDFFYCEKHNQRIPFEICGIRRVNAKEFDAYRICKKCRQYEKELLRLVPTREEIKEIHFLMMEKRNSKSAREVHRHLKAKRLKFNGEVLRSTKTKTLKRELNNWQNPHLKKKMAKGK